MNGGRGDFDVWEWDGDEIEVVGGMGDGDLEEVQPWYQVWSG